jgi:hypothetical protein
VTGSDDLVARELMLNRFKRLISEVLRGQMSRNTFETWEVDILLDMEACEIEARRRGEIFRQYERAVERQLENEDGPPMKLSQFLVLRARKLSGSNS